MTIEFCDPPEWALARRRVRAKLWSPILDPLRDRPGEWAVIKTCAKPGTAQLFASNLRLGRTSWGNAGEFDAVEDGCTVYAMYIGEG